MTCEKAHVHHTSKEVVSAAFAAPALLYHRQTLHLEVAVLEAASLTTS